MSPENLITVDETSMAHAQVLRGLLESQGIQVWLNQESAGAAIGLDFLTALGAVKIIVKETSAERARALVDAYYRGDLGSNSKDDQG